MGESFCVSVCIVTTSLHCTPHCLPALGAVLLSRRTCASVSLGALLHTHTPAFAQCEHATMCPPSPISFFAPTRLSFMLQMSSATRVAARLAMPSPLPFHWCAQQEVHLCQCGSHRQALQADGAATAPADETRLQLGALQCLCETHQVQARALA